MLEEKVDVLIEHQKKTNELLEQLLGGVAAEELEVAVVEEVTKPKTTKKKAAKKKAAKKKPAPEPEDDDFGLGDTDAVTVTPDDVKEMLTSIVKKDRGVKAREIFSSYGAKKITDVAEEDLAPLYAELETLNEEE